MILSRAIENLKIFVIKRILAMFVKNILTLFRLLYHPILKVVTQFFLQIKVIRGQKATNNSDVRKHMLMSYKLIVYTAI